MIFKRYTYIIVVFCCFQHLQAQDLEPRLMSMMPVKGNFFAASYSFSHGNVLLDQTLPVEDMKARVHLLGAGYARSFGLFGQLAKVDAVLPYCFSNWDGMVDNTDTSTNRTGFGDPLLRLSVILLGGPAIPLSEYSKHELKRFRLGLKFRIRVPLGQYDPDKLINLGVNRWSFKLGLGSSYQINNFRFEAHLNSWFFTANKDFYGENTLKQHPLLSCQVHGVYIIKRGMWVSLSFGASVLGQVYLNGEELQESKNGMRFGIAYAFPIGKVQGFKLAYTNGAATRYGADFNTIIFLYQILWFDKNK